MAFLECGAIGISPLAHAQLESGSLTLVMAVGTEGADGRSVAITGCKRIGRQDSRGVVRCPIVWRGLRHQVQVLPRVIGHLLHANHLFRLTNISLAEPSPQAWPVMEAA